MTKSEKIIFKGARRSLRKMLTEIHAAKRDPKRKGFMMLHLVEKPAFVVLTTGERVAYEGP